MLLNSVRDLQNYNQIILVDEKASAKSILENINKNNSKTLILCVADELPKNYKSIIEKVKNVNLLLFSWSLFNSKVYEIWHHHQLSIKNSKIIYDKLKKNNKILVYFFKKLYSSNNVEYGFIKLKFMNY